MQEPTTFKIETEDQLNLASCHILPVEDWTEEMHIAWARHIDPTLFEAMLGESA